MSNNRNGYFQLEIHPDGTFLHLFPSVGEGEPLNGRELEDYLATKRIGFDRISVLGTVQKNQEETIKLNSEKIRPVDEFMTFNVSDDLMEVVCRFYPPSKGDGSLNPKGESVLGGAITSDEIAKDLKYNQITAEPDMDKINDFLNDRKYCTDYVLAVGTPVTRGEDGYVEYMFDTDPVARPKKNEDGSVDFHSLNSVRACSEGQVLAKLHKEVPGSPGYNVFGEMIMPNPVKSASIKHSKGSTLSEDGVLTSDVNGHVSLTEGMVFVSNVLELKDVDVSTGDIEYDGNLLVNGNITTGYKVKVTGDVEVKGVIEAAEVEAGGQVTVAKGINGMDKGKIKAGHSVIAKYINSAEVESGGLIHAELVLNSKISAQDSIIVEGRKGFITGGFARAGNKIEAKTIGSDMGAPTSVEVGIDPAIKAKRIALIKENEEIRASLSRTEPVLLATVERLKRGEKLPPEQLKKMQDLNKVIQSQKSKLQSNNDELEMIELSFDDEKIAEVVVTGMAYPGTHIMVSDANLTLKKEYHYCRFRREGADVRMMGI
ncbi:MAG: FapA family protein [Lachnospiraceae bacterium]|nr:FapA family protein [Lachnospiraceae bacterium]